MPKSQMLLHFLEAPIKMAFMLDKFNICCIRKKKKIYPIIETEDVIYFCGFHLNICGDNLKLKARFVILDEISFENMTMRVVQHTFGNQQLFQEAVIG